MTTTILIIGGVLFLIMIIKKEFKREDNIEKNIEKFNKLGMTQDNKIKLGNYLGGHPDVDEEYTNVVMFRIDNSLKIFTEDENLDYNLLCEIPIEQIKNVTVEDETTVEKRISAGRILLVGVFALAWKKKVKHEKAFLIIEWNDGRFDHNTIFLFNSENSMTTANTSRNAIIKSVR